MTDATIEVFQEKTLDETLKPLAEIVTSAGVIAEANSKQMADFYREYYKRAGVTIDMSFMEKAERLSKTSIDDLFSSNGNIEIKERFTSNPEGALKMASQNGPIFEGVLKIKTIFSAGMYGKMTLKLVYFAKGEAQQVFEKKGGMEGLIKMAYHSLSEPENIFYFCEHCDGFIKGYPGGKHYSTPCMGLAGGSGTDYSCKRCDEILVNDAFCSS